MDLNDRVCSVCLDSSGEEVEWFTLQCKHTMHLKCIESVIAKFECPICRAKITQSTLPLHTQASVKRNSRKFKQHQEAEEVNNLRNMLNEENRTLGGTSGVAAPSITTAQFQQIEFITPEALMQTLAEYLQTCDVEQIGDDTVMVNFRVPIPADMTPEQQTQFRENTQANLTARLSETFSPYNYSAEPGNNADQN